MPPRKKETKLGGLCIICGEYVFGTEGLEAHYQTHHGSSPRRAPIE